MKHTKILSLLLAVLLLALLGCGGGDKTAGTTQSGEKTGTVEGTVETAPAATEAPQEETPQEENPQEETPQEEDPQEEAAPAEEGPLTGALQNNVYTNEYFALGCALDENWRFITREEIAQFNSETAEMIDVEDVKAALKEDGSYYMDMAAEADEGLVQINAVIENIGVIYGITMDESGYIDAALERDLNAKLAAMGMENVKIEKNEVELAGAAHAGIRVEAEYQGVSLYQQVVAVKKNSYVMAVNCTCWGEDILSTMLGYFYALD